VSRSGTDLPATPVRPDASPPSAAVPTTDPGRHRLRYAVVAAVLLGAFAFLLAKGLGGSLDYFETVDQALSQQAQLGGRTFRLEGLVVPGSVVRSASGVDFVAAGAHRRVTVHNTGSPPQLFQPDVPVVVVGHFVGDVFVSDQIIVDHSAQYIEQHPGRVRAPNGSTR
jgi:cytochrome c-type biogenesis protein CcmE